MKRHSLFVVFGLLVIASMVLAACAQATPTEAPPAATEAPVTAAPATEAPTAAPAFVGDKLAAPDCNYGTSDVPASIKSIEAVDQYTVKFTLCNPDPAFASKVAFTDFAITEKAFLDKMGGDSVKMSDAPDGTGPYMLKEWVRGDHITFVANPNYWGPKPKTTTVIFKWQKEAAQRLLELQAGTADGIDNPAPEDFATIQKDTNLQLVPRQALNIFYIGFNNTLPPFNGPNGEKVRQALAMAIDKQRIVDNFYPAGSSVADEFVPSFLKPGYTDNFPWYKFDTDAAKKLLADAGFPNGFDVTLSYRDVVRGYLPLPGKVAQDIQAQLAKIGVRVKIEVMESTAFLDATSAGQKPFYLLGWTGDYPDSTNFYDYHFANGNNKQFGDLFSDLVTEIKAAGGTSDPVQRQAHYDKVNQLIYQHVPMIPVAHGGSATAYKASITGAHSSPLGDEYFAVDGGTTNDTFVWIQNGEPGALWCADETDGEAIRACLQMYDSLLSFKVGGTEVQPGLAETYESNADLTEWTFHLRHGVKFFSGNELNANDVVATFVAQWDASSPNHKGRTGNFEYFGSFFGAMLNVKK